MRILHVIASVDPEAGGVIEGTLNSSKEMIRHGHTVEFASLDGPSAAFVEDFPLTCHALGPGRSSYGFAARYRRWMLDNVGRYDCVIIQGMWQYHALAARSACMRYDVPYFVFPHGMLDPWFKRQYPLKHLKKWLYWPWGDYRVLRDARAVLFTTLEESQLARQSFWLYKANERVVGFGIKGVPDNADAQKRAFYQSVPELEGVPYLLFLSRIHFKKGCDLLINAFADIVEEYPYWHLVMAGPDQAGLRAKLELVCAKRGITNKVHWMGMISGDVKWGAFRAAEAFVLPSHQENFGIVVPEAMACGTPVLTTDKVNIWREIEMDKAGIIHTDTEQSTYEALIRFLTLGPEERKAMAAAARDCFEKRYRIEVAAQNLMQVIKEMV